MELGLSKDEILEVWEEAWRGGKEPPPGGALGAVLLALAVYVGNVVRANNRRLQEQLEKAGIRFE